jgi:hypothetical protein
VPNTRLSLPNKLFEFVQARLALAVWPCPEMARMVREHDLGVVSEDFTVASMATELSRLTREDIAGFKANAHRAAKHLCAEANREPFLDLVHKLAEAPGRAP